MAAELIISAETEQDIAEAYAWYEGRRTDNKAGNRINYRIYESVINSNERMTYTSVKKILEDRDNELIERYSDLSANQKDACLYSKMPRPQTLGTLHTES